MNRNEIYHNDKLRVVEENGKLVIVTNRKKDDIVIRTFKEDYKKLSEGMTSKEFFKKHDLVYSKLDCPDVGGTLWMFTGNNDPSRHCHLTDQDLNDLLYIVKKELKCPYIVVGRMKDVSGTDMESGYILTTNQKISCTKSDKVCTRCVLKTSDPDIKFELYDLLDDDYTYDDFLDHIHSKYKVNIDKAMGLYGFGSTKAFITGFDWFKLPKNNQYYSWQKRQNG